MLTEQKRLTSTENAIKLTILTIRSKHNFRFACVRVIFISLKKITTLALKITVWTRDATSIKSPERHLEKTFSQVK